MVPSFRCSKTRTSVSRPARTGGGGSGVLERSSSCGCQRAGNWAGEGEAPGSRAGLGAATAACTPLGASPPRGIRAGQCLPDPPLDQTGSVSRRPGSNAGHKGGGGRPGRTHAAVPVVCRRGPCAASGRDRVLLRSVTVCDACPACLLLASPRTTPRFLLGASCALSPLLHLLPAISFASLPHHTALSDYSAQYETARGTYLEAAKALKMATGPYKASRDAYVAAASAYTKSLYD
eukprot:Tamp_19194.p3 GENE.Tamp_19194~~Tamp_19194.p3  ORF type:complete len:235 (-),score=10.55 Tamp_19194:376-1080(-)